MQQLETELSALRKRATLLDKTRAAAQADLDRALAAREKFMLTGDLEDTKLGTKLQGAVDSALSSLAGFDGSIRKQAALIAEIEAKIATEKQIAERKAASETLAAQIKLVEETLGPWLQLSHNLAAALEAIGWRFESAQMAAFVKNAASEIANAAALSHDDLHRCVARVRDGALPIPRAAPAVIEPPKPAPEAPTKTVFFLRHAKFTDADGRLRALGKMRKHTLPLHLAEKALATGAAIPETDPRVRDWQGVWGMVEPSPDRCEALDDTPSTDAPENPAEPIRHSAFEPHPDYINAKPKTFTVKTTPVEPMTATRSLPEDDEP